MRKSSSPVLVSFLGGLYEALLVFYPRSFRRVYGLEMAQVFRTACREMQRRKGASSLVLLCSRTLGELVWSGLCERLTRLCSRDVVMRVALSLVALLLASLAGSLQGRHDADDTVLTVLLAGSFLCGIIHPKGAWWWALLIGLGLPGGRILMHLTGFTHATDAELPLVFVPTFVGAYAGAAVRWMASRSWSRSALRG
jgi:hypothetical protein